MKLETKVVHAGQKPDKETGAIMPPIYMTSTFVQEAPGEDAKFEYTRAGNPNFEILEELLKSLENGKYATVFSSGLAALTALASTLKSGDTIAVMQGIYGGTYRLLNDVFTHFGIHFKQATPDNLESLLKEKPNYLIFETPTNPLLDIYDIEKIAALAKSYGVKVVCDNTFATPFAQNPLDLGCDIVWHSTTKYIGGHSDVVGGVLITNDENLQNKFQFARKAIGLNPSPFDAWLVNRGVKTLGLRMARHSENALYLAQYLEKQPLVKKVYYPGLPSHKGHDIAKKQMRLFSGMLSCEFHLSLEEAKNLISSFEIFSLAESLGGVESLVSHPASMTHASIPKDVREKSGLSDALIRFSVGIEDKDDLKQDIEKALEKIGAPTARS